MFEDCLHVEGLVYLPCFMPKLLLHFTTEVTSYMRWPVIVIFELKNEKVKQYMYFLKFTNSSLKKVVSC